MMIGLSTVCHLNFSHEYHFVLAYDRSFGNEYEFLHKHKHKFVFVRHKHKKSFGIAPMCHKISTRNSLATTSCTRPPQTTPPKQ